MGLMRSMEGHFHARVESSGVPPGEVMALWRLREGGAMPMGAMASCMHLDPSQVTLLVDRLERRGYAERRPHPQDRRVKLVGLTPDGETFLDELWSSLHEDAPGLARLGRADLLALRRILRKAGMGEPAAQPAGRVPARPASG
jgi:DNA-binding MarR family transcriptional regulator